MLFDVHVIYIFTCNALVDIVILQTFVSSCSAFVSDVQDTVDVFTPTGQLTPRAEKPR